jgi:hypothetical protein
MAPVQFTTLIRLPFARGSFEDPPQVRSADLHTAISLIHARHNGTPTKIDSFGRSFPSLRRRAIWTVSRLERFVNIYADDHRG